MIYNSNFVTIAAYEKDIHPWWQNVVELMLPSFMLVRFQAGLNYLHVSL